MKYWRIIYMSQEIEIEYKNLLTIDEYKRLFRKLPFPEIGQEQVNYYFETIDFALRKNSCALRIREKNKIYQLTLKEPHPQGLLETHDLLTKSEALSWLKGHIIEKEHIKKQLATFNISFKNLLYFGSLTTIRREVKYNNVLLVLDQSTYNGQTDYEFELEANTVDIGLQVFNDLLHEHKIVKKDTPNKIQRFFTTIPK